MTTAPSSHRYTDLKTDPRRSLIKSLPSAATVNARTFPLVYSYETDHPFGSLTESRRSQMLVQSGVRDTIRRYNTGPDCLGETCHNPVVCGVFTVERAVIDERTS